MQTQERRDRKTVDIAVGLGLFALIVAVGAVSLWVAMSVFGLSEDAAGAIQRLLFVVAGIAVIVHLARVRAR